MFQFIRKKLIKIIILILTTILLGLNGYFFIYKPTISALYLRGVEYYQKRQDWQRAFGFYQAMLKQRTYVTDNSVKFTENFYNGLIKSDFEDKKQLAAIINGITSSLADKHPLRIYNYLVFSRQLEKYGLYFPKSKITANILAREVLRKKVLPLSPNRSGVYNLLAVSSYGAGDYVNASYYINQAIKLNPNIKSYQRNKDLIMGGIRQKLKEK